MQRDGEGKEKMSEARGGTKGHFALVAESKSDNRMMKLTAQSVCFSLRREKRKSLLKKILEEPSGLFLDWPDARTHARTHKGCAVVMVTSSQRPADITLGGHRRCSLLDYTFNLRARPELQCC